QRLEGLLVAGGARQRQECRVEADRRVAARTSREHVDALGQLSGFLEVAKQSAHRVRELRLSRVLIGEHADPEIGANRVVAADGTVDGVGKESAARAVKDPVGDGSATRALTQCTN